MNIDNAIRVLAGTLVLISIVLSHFINPNWLWLGVFVGVNLIQSAFTGFCPAAMIFRKIGLKG
ncbi:MAG: YgaP family membrane protein [Kiritimatiellia bacterium]|jgi:hypothetical protein